MLSSGTKRSSQNPKNDALLRGFFLLVLVYARCNAFRPAIESISYRHRNCRDQSPIAQFDGIQGHKHGYAGFG